MAINGQFSRPSLAQILTLKKYINVKKKKKKKSSILFLPFILLKVMLHDRGRQWTKQSVIYLFFFEDRGQRQNKGNDRDRLSRA